MYVCVLCVVLRVSVEDIHTLQQVASLERELEETRERAAQFEEEIEEQSQGQDMQLLDSQVYKLHRVPQPAGHLVHYYNIIGSWALPCGMQSVDFLNTVQLW